MHETLKTSMLLAGLTALQELILQGCRNIVNARGRPLPGLAGLCQLTHLSLRNCEGLQDGAFLGLLAVRRLKSVDISGCQKITGAG